MLLEIALPKSEAGEFHHYPTFAAMCGVGINCVVLTVEDFQRMQEARPEQLKEWLNALHCRFVSGATPSIVEARSAYI